MYTKSTTLGLLLLLLTATSPVQSIEAEEAEKMPPALELEAVINADVINYAQAAYFVLASSEDNSEITAQTAFRFALDKGWLPKKAAADDPAKLGALSFLLMKSFNMRGGFLYAVFPGPRYAYREMVGLNIIQGTADPSMTISGERFLLILGNVLKIAGGES